MKLNKNPPIRLQGKKWDRPVLSTVTVLIPIGLRPVLPGRKSQTRPDWENELVWQKQHKVSKDITQKSDRKLRNYRKRKAMQVRRKVKNITEVTLHSPGNGGWLLTWFPREASTRPTLRGWKSYFTQCWKPFPLDFSDVTIKQLPTKWAE